MSSNFLTGITADTSNDGQSNMPHHSYVTVHAQK